MEAFFNSWWFQVVKSALAVVAAGILAAAAEGSTTLPVWLSPVLLGISGALQVGQAKK